jgi:hypothetical protein
MGELRFQAKGRAKQQSESPALSDLGIEPLNILRVKVDAPRNRVDGIKAELNLLAESKIANSSQKVEFRRDLDTIASNHRLSEKEKYDTLAQIKRFWEPSAKLDESARTKLARQVARNAAKPTYIDQGDHNTCNVASLECRLYARTPSIPSKLVADLALTGQIRTADGTTVRPLSLAPDKEGRQDPVPDGQRSYASQLFQLAAANIYWNRQTTMPDGTAAGKNMIYFDQVPSGSSGNTGEQLIDISKNPPRKYELKKQATDNPRLGLEELADINAQLVGKKETDFAIIRGGGSSADGIIGVDSSDQLRQTLTRLKAENKFPVLLQVDASIKPFGSGDTNNGKFEPHAVTIVDFDAAKAQVAVDNQWGHSSDHFGETGTKSRIDCNTLFGSMRSTPPLANVAGHLWKNFKDIDSADIVQASKAGLSTALLWSSLSGSTANALTIGLKNAGATSLAAATESGAGRLLTRGGTAVGALGVAIVVNDLHKAFLLGPEHGTGKLARVGLTSVAFELGSAGGASLASTLKMTGLGKYGLLVGAGLAAATAYDATLGEGIEMMGAAVYRKVFGRR